MEVRGTGERARGLATESGALPGTLGKENECSDVGVESSTAAVVDEGV